MELSLRDLKKVTNQCRDGMVEQVKSMLPFKADSVDQLLYMASNNDNERKTPGIRQRRKQMEQWR